MKFSSLLHFKNQATLCKHSFTEGSESTKQKQRFLTICSGKLVELRVVGEIHEKKTVLPRLLQFFVGERS